MLHYETVSPHLLSVLKKIQQLPEVSAFRLVGGTSLSLQLGHRISVDIDLFTNKSFDISELQKTLHKTFNSFEVLWSNKNGFVSVIDDIKVDFFDWHVPFLKAAVIENGICLADKEDIAAMKEYVSNLKSDIVKQQEERIRKAEKLLKEKNKKS